MESVEMRGLKSWLRRVGVTEVVQGLISLDPDAAVFAVNAEREVILWSAGAEKLLGIPAQEAIGKSCLSSQRCVQCLKSCGLSTFGTITDQPLEVFDSSGSPLPVRKTAWAFQDESGEFLGGVERLVYDPNGANPARSRPRRDAGEEEFHGILTRDSGMKRLFHTVRAVAETASPVLVRGESGSGKELVARAVHAESMRSEGPFVAVNCAALSPTLLESELFGHVKGAFTGAVKDRAGLFRQASTGTLFLDEVAELPLDLQAKLLRVLEEQRVTPVGASTQAIPVDVRIISATHRSLRAEVNAKRFRQDLMFRLRVVPIFIPALRERLGDVELLLWALLEEQSALGGRTVTRIAPEAMRALLDHPWPGNVRELRNVVQYATAVGRGSELVLDELPPEFRGLGPHLTATGTFPSAGAPLEPAALTEEARIRAALERTGGKIGEAAELLGVSRATFWRKRRELGL